MPKKPVEKPFDAKHLKAAKAAVEDYEIVLHHEDGEWRWSGVRALIVDSVEISR